MIFLLQFCFNSMQLLRNIAWGAQLLGAAPKLPLKLLEQACQTRNINWAKYIE